MALAALVCGLAAVATAADAPPAMIVPGQFNVSATGAATYTIPIAVPPGTAGMVPALSLDYSSQAGNGIVGIGWSLSGLPSITHCARTLAQDGVHGSVNYDTNDRFCMDGQRLVAITGSYGADSTEYRTEIDAFSKIVSYGTTGNGPTYFKVWTKSGQIMEFGNTSDSRLLTTTSPTTVIAWGVNKITDVKGNYLTVSYTSGSGVIYPSEIDYTGNASSNLTPYNSVKFVYSSRSDQTTMFLASNSRTISSLLTDIKTYQGSNLVYDYHLDYQAGSSTWYSQLSKVTLCDANSSCLAPTTFTWQGTNGAVAVTPMTTNAFLDVSYSATTTNYMSPEYGDFNGDGLIDVLSGAGISQTGSSTYTVSVGVNQGTNTPGTFNITNYTATTPIPSCPEANCSPAFSTVTSVGDVNADSFSDINLSQVFNVQATGGYTGQATYAYTMTSNGVDTFASSNVVTTSYASGDFKGDGYQEYIGSTGAPAAPPSGTTAIVGDFNGDGCTDVLEQGGTDAILFSCNAPSAQLTLPNWTSDKIYIGDFNGDGLSDILVVSKSGATPYLSTGNGLSQLPTISNSSSWYNDNLVLGDFNGDGKTDIAVVPPSKGATVTIYVSQGVFFAQAASFTNTDQSTLLAAIDMNNDGIPDLVGNHTIYLMTYKPQLMTAVANGIGATTTITYDRLNENGSLYTKCPNSPTTFQCGDAYPTEGMDGPYYVVSRVDASNGLTGQYSSTYSYGGAKVDLMGRKFLGFQTMSVTDLQTGVVQTSNYQTAFPFTGLMSSQTKSAGGVTLNSTSNTYADSVEGTGTEGVKYYFVSLSQSAVASHDLDGTAMPTSTTNYTYDGYGNALTVDVSVSDGSSKNTANSYTNDTANWHLGRLTNTSVTSSVPARGTGGTSGNSPPTAGNVSITANENTPYNFNPLTSDSDPDGDALTIVSVSTPAHGSVTNYGTSITYSPSSNYSGSDSFTYTISDGQGHTATGTISVTVAFVPPPTGTFTGSPSPVAPGGASTLSWTSSGATSASIDNGVGSLTAVSGGSVVVHPTATTTYTLTLTGAGGSTTKQATVTVIPTPTGSLTASPTSIVQGNSATLTWSSSNATSATIDNGVGAITPVSGGSVTVTPSVTTTYTMTLTGPTGTTTVPATVTVIGTPSGSLTANPATINLGSSSTLTWSTTNTTSASIDNGVGSVAPSGGTVTVSPTATTTYTLTMTGAGGTSTTKATVTIAAPTGTFTANPTAIARGASTTLTWSGTNATSASIDNGIGSKPTSGSVTVSPTTTTTYDLTLTGPSGTITLPLTVTVYQPPTATLIASPASVNLGGNSSLSWTTSNATSTSINQGVGTVTPVAGGSVPVTPTATTTYTLTATGPGGSTTAAATVTIPGPTGSFSASPTSINLGGSTSLSWSSTNATSASIDNGIGSEPVSGSVKVSPTTTTTYTLTLTGPSGTTTQQVTVTVNFNTTVQVTGSGPVNLRSLANAAGYNGAENATINFVVGSGVTIMGPAPGGVALDTGTWPSGYTTNLTLTVSGAVDGGGGTGGTGGAGAPNGTSGTNGGDAVYCRVPITIVVNSGGSVNGGGGGGGGGGISAGGFGANYGGGGGGGGFPNGAGGPGGTGTLISAGGNGGAGWVGGGGSGGSPYSGSGYGGDGGYTGAVGGSGSPGSSGSGGAGGAPGYAIRKNGNSVSVTNNGTIAGPQG